ncbi:MAG TPA: aminopeptidase P family N-terminal domain-containing protein, partial [Stellaceae bacterium]|nr:aminopeptidase P family N-terminal domain-containing protein [Stellaceae bacterium]
MLYTVRLAGQERAMDGLTPERGRLAELLAAAGSPLNIEAVDALVAGVLAAPPEIGTTWHALVAEPIPPDLAVALEARKASLAASHHDGVQPEDFARLPRAERLKLLRAQLSTDGLAGFIVPRADEHQGEYVPLCGQRLAWLTGFSGSAGVAVVLQDRAAIFVDGRYTLQAGAQVDTDAFEIRHLIDEPPAQWVATAAAKGDVIGYDPWLHTPQEVERLKTGVEKAGATLRPVAKNPLDAVWADRPAAPLAPVFPYADNFAGESAAEKRGRIGKALVANGVASAVLTMPESIAWLLNIRGGDVPHTPLPLSFAVVKADGAVTLFVDRRKLLPGLDRHLGNQVTIEAPDRLGPALDMLA